MIKINNREPVLFSVEPSAASVWSFFKTPFCPIAEAELGACDNAVSNAVFHS